MSSFCSAKATHIFSAKKIRILFIESARAVNEMTLNELVTLTTLWTTGSSKLILMPTSLGTNAVVVTRVHCILMICSSSFASFYKYQHAMLKLFHVNFSILCQINDSQRQLTYLRTRAPTKDSDQTAHSRAVWSESSLSTFWLPRMQGFFRQTTKTLISIAKTRLIRYIANFISKKWKLSDEKFR